MSTGYSLSGHNWRFPSYYGADYVYDMRDYLTEDHERNK